MMHKKPIYRKILDTYEKEMRPLLSVLPAYFEEDLNLFRIKVHGLKGASRQIGQSEIGDFAERMEYAAKDGDVEYIRRNLDYFLQKLEEILTEIAKAKEAIPVEKAQTVEKKENAEELFWELKKGFDSYNLKQIENVLALLEELELSEAQKDLLVLLQQACDELEYEKGSELLSRLD